MPNNNLSEVNIKTQVFFDKPICGFWRRIVAFLIDSIILFLFGSLLGLLFFEQFSRLGSLGPLVGFLITVFYYGLLDSNVIQGQSFGKRMLKIRVVNKDGTLIDLKTSFLRASLLSILIFSYGISFSNLELVGRTFVSLMSVLLIGMIYFYVFNTRTRQSLHDIVCRTYVYRVDAIETPIASAVARRHYVVYLLIVVVAGISSLYGQKPPAENNLQVLEALYKEVRELNGVHEAAVNLHHFKEGSQETKSLNVTVYVSDKSMQNDATQENAARIILEKYPEVYSLQRVNVNVMYGYNIGIASGWTKHIAIKSPVEWKEKLHILQLPNEKSLPSVLNKVIIEKIIKDITSFYNSGDNKAIYSMMGDHARSNIPYTDFEKGILKIRELGKMNNAVYTHYTHIQEKDGWDLFALFYAVDFELGKGYARVMITPCNYNNWQIVGIGVNVEK